MARPMAHPTKNKAPSPGSQTLVLNPDAALAESSVLPGVLAVQMVATPQTRGRGAIDAPSRTPPSPMPQDEPSRMADAVAAPLAKAAAPALLHPLMLQLTQLPSQQPAAMPVQTTLATESTHPAHVATKAADDGAINEQDGAPDPVSRDAEAETGALELPLAPALAAASTAAISAADATTPPLERALIATPQQAERPDGRREVVGAKTPSRASTASQDRKPRAAIDRVAADTVTDAKTFKALPADSADIDPAPALSISTTAPAPSDTSLPKAIMHDATPGAKQLATGPAAEPLVVARPGLIGHQVGVEIARCVSAGGDELVVRLIPAELGRIEVRMSFDERGGLRAVIAADSPAALEILRRDSADLSRSLSDAGVRSDSQSLHFQTDGGNGGTNHQRSPWLNANLRTARGASIGTTDDIDLTPYQQLRTSGRYDLLA